MIFNQTPKSSVISVKDVCLLPMCSKADSSDKALIIGSNILIVGQMYQKFQKVFWDNNFIPDISCAYAGHPQISCDILHYGGDNN